MNDSLIYYESSRLEIQQAITANPHVRFFQRVLGHWLLLGDEQPYDSKAHYPLIFDLLECEADNGRLVKVEPPTGYYSYSSRTEVARYLGPTWTHADFWLKTGLIEKEEVL